MINNQETKVGKKLENNITNCIIVKRKKLYGFDGGKQHKFVKFEFSDISAFNKAKNLWYSDYQRGHTLLKSGYIFNNCETRLYEANIPPLLRFFHIKELSPSGWICIAKKKAIEITTKKTTCDYEFVTCYKNIRPLNDKETRVPYKIMSFDIEASSSHGDFPLPEKNYAKLSANIVDVCNEHNKYDREFIKQIILTAFGYNKLENVEKVYPIDPVEQEMIESLFTNWITTKPVECKAEIKMDLGLTDLKYQSAAAKISAGGDDETGDGDGDGGSTTEIVRSEEVTEEVSLEEYFSE
jgi:hypothetical protein